MMVLAKIKYNYDETERLYNVTRDCIYYLYAAAAFSLKILNLPLDLHNSDITHRGNEYVHRRKKCKNKKHSCGCGS